MRRADAANIGDTINGSKLRASRVRRQRDRDLSRDEDEMTQRFGRSASLSLAAPVFVPAAQRARRPPATAAAPKRSMAFVTDRRGLSARSATSSTTAASVRAPAQRARWSATATAADKLHKNAAARKTQQQQQQQTRTRPGSVSSASGNSRRQRMGSKGLVQQQPSVKSKAVSLREQHRRKLSLTSTDLQLPDAPLDQNVETAPATTLLDVQDAVDVYPEPAASAFPQQLTLFSQQKRLPQRVASRDDVIDTIFEALFSRRERGRRSRPRQALCAFGDEGTDTDEPNEELVKQGLATALFKSQLHLHVPSSLPTAASPAAAADSLLTPTFLHALVNALRFEDFRVASVRLDILRAIHKSCPTKRPHLVRALADATALRVEHVAAVAARAEVLGVEKTSARLTTDKHDHGHGFTELLRYSIEHVEESLQATSSSSSSLAQDSDAAAQEQETLRAELVRNCMLSLVSLWRAHWVDPAGSDDEELISCAGQFVAYMPSVTGLLLKRLLSAWPTRFPKEEVGATRMVARVIMSGPPLQQVDPTHSLQRRVFTRLARALQSPKVDVAMEALAFVSCNFVLVHFLGRDEAIYKTITGALHANVEGHWHDGVRKASETHFDSALDFAPVGICTS
ncbi:unnamed protein product [Hyaloperonospora brassicae]|uniref:Uncharacterized protein n=1 Tax=Hyaloperonospora brassicae TaxID=162125 RepID=A0AAV0TGZ0_HYABA|nr:unnamed protein product [Hyaloperonospora brassicae]